MIEMGVLGDNGKEKKIITRQRWWHERDGSAAEVVA